MDVPTVLEAVLLARVGNFRRDWSDKAATAVGLPGRTPHGLLNRYGHHNDAGAARVAVRVSRAAEEAQEGRRKGRLHAV